MKTFAQILLIRLPVSMRAGFCALLAFDMNFTALPQQGLRILPPDTFPTATGSKDIPETQP